MMTGDAVPARRALEIGLVNRVVAVGDLTAETTKIAEKLAAGPTASIGRVKRMINASYSNDLSAQLALEHECQIQSGKADDFKEGVSAFFDKRAPNFTGN